MLEMIPMGPLEANCYLLYRKEQGEAVLIDPSDAKAALNALQKHGLTLTHILLTHRHYDHLAGVGELNNLLHPEILIHSEDADGLSDPDISLSGWMDGTLIPSRPSRILEDGDTFTAAGYSFRVLHTPGHTAGGVCFVCDEEQIAFTGDTVFCGGTGRTDLPSGSLKELIQSICERVFSLPASYVLYPGHGDATTVGQESRSNPILQYRRNPWFS